MKNYEEAALKFALAKRINYKSATAAALSKEIPEYVAEARNVAIAQFMSENLNPLKGEKLVSYNTERKEFDLDERISEPEKVREALKRLTNYDNFGNKVLRDIAEEKHEGILLLHEMMDVAEIEASSTKFLTGLATFAFLLFSCYKAISNPASLTNFASFNTILSNPLLQSATCLLGAKFIFNSCNSSLLRFQKRYECAMSDFLGKAVGSGMLINYQETQLHVDQITRLKSLQQSQGQQSK
jgi:hypothetical protein